MEVPFSKFRDSLTAGGVCSVVKQLEVDEGGIARAVQSTSPVGTTFPTCGWWGGRWGYPVS